MELGSLRMGGVADPQYTPLPHMCYLAERVQSAALKGVVISRRTHKIGERRGSAAFGRERDLPIGLRNMPPLRVSYHIKFGTVLPQKMYA